VDFWPSMAWMRFPYHGRWTTPCAGATRALDERTKARCWWAPSAFGLGHQQARRGAVIHTSLPEIHRAILQEAGRDRARWPAADCVLAVAAQRRGLLVFS